ncbi:hypothetical protein [Flavobacterium ardleyense]|uniref:hypothetical protein n=1 Tax=Flavobacterium ardleyense TaxID=2038737 RepID=UPI00298D3BFC|nr:hypothetical protein [Flavobacterium ardleyense]
MMRNQLAIFFAPADPADKFIKKSLIICEISGRYILLPQIPQKSSEKFIIKLSDNLRNQWAISFDPADPAEITDKFIKKLSDNLRNQRAILLAPADLADPADFLRSRRYFLINS